MEAAKKVGLAAITVEEFSATMTNLLRKEPILGVISAKQTYAAIVSQFVEIPKIQTASTQRKKV